MFVVAVVDVVEVVFMFVFVRKGPQRQEITVWHLRAEGFMASMEEMMDRVWRICIRHVGARGEEGSLRRQMQGIREAWKMK